MMIKAHISSARTLLNLRISQHQRAFTANTPARTVTTRAMSTSKDMILTQTKENPVMVYSKTYCPYCSEVKQLFDNLKVPAKTVEIDNLPNGPEVQAALAEVTGRRTVPQVFIGSKHVGGCDDTLAAYRNGELKALLAAAGISI